MNSKAFFVGFLGLVIVSAIVIFSFQLNSSSNSFETSSSNISLVNFALFNYFSVSNDSVVDAVSDFIYSEHACSSSNLTSVDVEAKIKSYLDSSTTKFNSYYDPIDCSYSIVFSNPAIISDELSYDFDITCELIGSPSSISISKTFSSSKRLSYSTLPSGECNVVVKDFDNSNYVDLNVTSY